MSLETSGNKKTWKKSVGWDANIRPVHPMKGTKNRRHTHTNLFRWLRRLMKRRKA